MPRVLVFPGDSQSLGISGSPWSELVADRLANIPGVGPRLSSGVQVLTYSGTWTALASTDAFDVAPYGGSTLNYFKYANGSSNIATYTRTDARPTVGFDIYWIDYPSGGDWTYRIDGGPWTFMGQSRGGATANKLCKFHVALPVYNKVEIRAANFLGTGVGCLPVYVELTYSDASDGLIVHTIALAGSRLHELTLSTSGDRMAFFDSVQLGSGSPVSPSPNVGVVQLGNINDVLAANTTTWATDLTALNARVSPLGPLGLICPYGCDTGTYNDTQQTDYRAQTATSAEGFGTPAKVMSIFDQWNLNGWGTTNALQSSIGVTDGRLTVDGIHQTAAGHLDMATRIYWFVRNQILGLGNVSSTYTATAKQAAVQYAGKQAAAQYAAGAPISV